MVDIQILMENTQFSDYYIDFKGDLCISYIYPTRFFGEQECVIIINGVRESRDKGEIYLTICEEK
jgi:hypothetical protein